MARQDITELQRVFGTRLDTLAHLLDIGETIENLKPESIQTLAQAREAIAQTRARVEGITAEDAKLDEVKRIGLGPGRYCELPARQYVADYLLPNLYFHVTAAYAILRHLGAPLGKSDYMSWLAPYVRTE